MALMCRLSQELCLSERASASSLDLADGSFHFRGGDCHEAAAERGLKAGIGGSSVLFLWNPAPESSQQVPARSPERGRVC